MNSTLHRVVRAAVLIRRNLGAHRPLEVYRAALKQRLTGANLPVKTDVQVPARRLHCSDDRLEIIIGRSLLIELKHLPKLEKVHDQQMLYYLAATGVKAGLLLNFGAAVFRQGIRSYRNQRRDGREISLEGVCPVETVRIRRLRALRRPQSRARKNSRRKRGNRARFENKSGTEGW